MFQRGCLIVYSTELLQKIKTWSIGPAHVMLLCVGLATVTLPRKWLNMSCTLQLTITIRQ